MTTIHAFMYFHQSWPSKGKEKQRENKTKEIGRGPWRPKKPRKLCVESVASIPISFWSGANLGGRKIGANEEVLLSSFLWHLAHSMVAGEECLNIKQKRPARIFYYLRRPQYRLKAPPAPQKKEVLKNSNEQPCCAVSVLPRNGWTYL